MDKVILVNHRDEPLGEMEKMQAHRQGILHRAVSVFIINSHGQWLLQQRADHKYHSAGLWSNAACTHPFPGEDNLTAAKRRLKEEMGVEAELTKVFDFIYRADLDNNLIEHEFDHVFIGISDNLPYPDPQEVKAYKYVDWQWLEKDVQENPQNYTEWFKLLYWRIPFYVEKLLK